MSIESELLKATGQKVRGSKEAEQTYLTRIALESNNLGDDDWKKLSVEAQEWMNVASESYDSKRPIPGFGGKAAPADAAPADADPAEAEAEGDEVEGDETDAAEEAAAEEAPAPAKAKPAKADKSAVTKAEKPAKAEKPKKAEKAPAADGEKRGGSRRMRELICEDPTLEQPALKAKLDEEGYKISDITFNATYYDVKSTIRLLSDLGKLKAKVSV